MEEQAADLQSAALCLGTGASGLRGRHTVHSGTSESVWHVHLHLLVNSSNMIHHSHTMTYNYDICKAQ